ncbi:MAG: hypothetical protein LBV47_00325 [Bacteroidales bacterium]|jgi:hypothetical protein|nr:hypothetical protein [Bacteroidales bacterium]
MKHLIFGIIATAIVAAMVLFACNKSQVEDVEFSAMEEQALINPANPDNPFDYYGDLHNKGLRIALDELKDSPDASFEERIRVSGQAAQKVLSEEGMAMSKSTVNITDTAEFIAAMEFLIDDMKNNYVNFIESLNVDFYTKRQLQFFFHDIIAMSEIEGLTYNDVSNKIIEFEDKILNNIIAIPSNEREVVLAGTSTMRYSLNFWAEEMDLIDPETGTLRRGGWKWWHYGIVVAADALGAMAGCGSVGGVVLFGVGYSGLAAAIINIALNME